MMTIRLDKPKVEKNLFRKEGKTYEKLESLKVSASIRVVSVIDGTITDLKTVKKSRDGLEDKTYDDLPGITVEAAVSAIDSYVVKPIQRRTTRATTGGKTEYPTWVYVAGGVAVVGALVYLAGNAEGGKECVKYECKLEECAEYDASGNCIEWECAEEECVEWGEEEEDTSAAPALHPASYPLNRVTFSRHRVNHPSSKLQQLFGNFEVRVKLFEWRF